MNIAEIIGWIGAGLYIVAYFLLSIGLLKAKSIIYHLLNILGAIGLVINAKYLYDLPNIIVNLVWLTIGASAIYIILKRKATLLRKQ